MPTTVSQEELHTGSSLKWFHMLEVALAQLQSLLFKCFLQKCTSFPKFCPPLKGSTCHFTGFSQCMLGKTPETQLARNKCVKTMNKRMSNIFHYCWLFVRNLLFTCSHWVRFMTWQIRTCFLFSVYVCVFRYNGQTCGIPGGKHGEARPPLQSLQDEPPPQMWEWSGTAALHGKAGKNDPRLLDVI